MLSFSQQAATGTDQRKPKAMGPKAALDPDPNEQSQAKRGSYISK